MGQAQDVSGSVVTCAGDLLSKLKLVIFSDLIPAPLWASSATFALPSPRPQDACREAPPPPTPPPRLSGSLIPVFTASALFSHHFSLS